MSSTSAPALRSSSGSASRAMSARGSSMRWPVEAPVALQRRDDALGAILVGHHVHAKVQALQTFGRRRSDGADARPVQVADVAHCATAPAA